MILLIALAWLAFWTIFDIVIIEYIFKPVNIWAHPNYKNLWGDGIYHITTFLFIIPLTTLIAFGLSFTTLYIIIMFLGGWEDIFYFWFQRKRVPDKLPWLPISPTKRLLYIRAVAALVIIVLLVGKFFT